MFDISPRIAPKCYLVPILRASGSQHRFGLNDAEWNLVRARARQALHPEQTEMEQLLTKALDDVREGVAATKRMLLERCEMREDDDGQFRSIREPLPGRRLATSC